METVLSSTIQNTLYGVPNSGILLGEVPLADNPGAGSEKYCLGTLWNGTLQW